jgi:hypothetical protein
MINKERSRGNSNKLKFTKELVTYALVLTART